MMNIYYIARKELREYFTSVLGYVFLTMLLFLTGLFYWFAISAYAQGSEQLAANPSLGELPNLTEFVIGGLFESMGVFFLLVNPLVAMRLLAEERRNRTLELLLTSPVSSTEIVLGKFFGAVAFFSVFLIATLNFPLILAKLGTVDPGPIWTAYLGALLLGSACLAIGLLASSLTQHQLVAAVVAFTISLTLWVVSWVGSGGTHGEFWNYISILEQYQGFTKGTLKLESVVYYLSLIVVSLFATLQRLESLRRQ